VELKKCNAMENLEDKKILDSFIGMLLSHQCTHSSHEQRCKLHSNPITTSLQNVKLNSLKRGSGNGAFCAANFLWRSEAVRCSLAAMLVNA